MALTKITNRTNQNFLFKSLIQMKYYGYGEKLISTPDFWLYRKTNLSSLLKHFCFVHKRIYPLNLDGIAQVMYGYEETEKTNDGEEFLLTKCLTLWFVLKHWYAVFLTIYKKKRIKSGWWKTVELMLYKDLEKIAKNIKFMFKSYLINFYNFYDYYDDIHLYKKPEYKLFI